MTAIRSRGRRAWETLATAVTANDWRFVAVVMVAIYVGFTAFALALGQNVEGVVSTLRRITFLTAVYAMLALALNLHWGYTGLFNIGVAGFMAVGVYTMAALTTSPAATPPGLGLPLWVGIIAGVAMAGIVGGVAALPALRLEADYLAIVTVALSEIIRLSLLSTTLQRFTIAGVTLGSGGGRGIDLPTNPVRALYYRNPSDTSAGLTPLGNAAFELFGSIGIGPFTVIQWTYALVLVVFVAAFYWLLVRVGNSPFGRVLKAIREDELVASSLGKDTNRFKIKAFVVGAALMGLGGILWQGSRGFTSPGSFRPILTFYVFVALIIGGAGSNTGSVLGGALFASLLFEGPSFVGRLLEQAIEFGATPNTVVDALGPLLELDPLPIFAYTVDNIPSLRFVLIGVVLIYLMQNRPDGLLGHRKEIASSVDLFDRGDSRE